MKPKTKVQRVKKVDMDEEVTSEVPSEKEQLLARQEELHTHILWMQTNRFQDIGQVEVALSYVNQRLTEVP